MKLLSLALLALPGLAAAAEPAWLQERLISATADVQLQGRDQILPLRQYLQLPPGAQVNDVIVTAATAAGQGRLEVVVDGRSLTEIRVERQLKAITIPVNLRLDPRTTLQLRTDGNFYIAQVAVTIARRNGPVPPPPPPPPPPVDNRRECENFAFNEIRADGYSNADALNLSAQYCSANQDLFRDRQVFERVYSLLREEGYGRRDALNLTATYVRQNLDVLYERELFDRVFSLLREEGYGRRDALNLTADFVRRNLTVLRYRYGSFNWIYDRLREDGYGRRDSMNLTAEMMGRVSEYAMPCTQDKFNLFRADGYGRRDSLNKAIQFCQR